jgi:hypothetical protein
MRHWIFYRTFLFLSLVSLLGCTEPNPLYQDEFLHCEAGDLVIQPFQMTHPQKVDILFVVDNSDSMSEVQLALSESLIGFIDTLNSHETLDYHLGVISTDIGEIGRLQTGQINLDDCPEVQVRFVTRNTPNGAIQAACNVRLGEDGDPYQAGLEAIRYALAGPAAEPGGENDGFLRKNARLVVIVVSNEDDCSSLTDAAFDEPLECIWSPDELNPLSLYAGDTQSFFPLIKAPMEGQAIDFIAIVGPDDSMSYEEPEEPEPSCSGIAEAYSGRRYLSVVSMMGDRGAFYNICTPQYEDIMEEIANQHIMARSELICPLLNIEGVPLRVILKDENNNLIELPEDNTGYIYLGPDDNCPHGNLLISTALRGHGEEEKIEVTYCTLDPLSTEEEISLPTGEDLIEDRDAGISEMGDLEE